ncbi:MAG TPA: FAD-binding protein [Acidobacteriota bacterium]|jgi:FAD/FMN-containing dehydrogenase
MNHRISRRSFVGLATGATALLVDGFDPRARSWISTAEAFPRMLDGLPRLDGSLLVDAASRQAFGVDVGRNSVRLPVAVLQPGSVQDVVSIVHYANKHRLKVAMRGQAHSQYGQSLVEGGVLIDSTTLKNLRLVGRESVNAQAGASWGAVNELTVAQQLTPLVMGDTMNLSVGGMLSVGGWGNTSQHHGAIVDTVDELDVVTGSGQRMKCSLRSNAELFQMVLAGLGQCALIVGARIRLQSAPSHVIRQDLVYDDLAAYIEDANRVILDRRFDHQNAQLIQQPDGRWQVRFNVGIFQTLPKAADLDARLAGLRFSSRSERTQTSYRDYLYRMAPILEARRVAASGSRSASVVMFVPASAAEKFTREILSTPALVDGRWRFDFAPLNTRLFGRPLFKLPDEEIIFSLWLFRSTPVSDMITHTARLESNRVLLEKMRRVGGKAYPPYTPYTTSAEWEKHYGPAVWQRLSEAKKKFDPANILTPGPGMFST